MKDWILTIGIDKYYLTEKEADFYSKSVERGAKIIAIRPTLSVSSNLQSLVHKSEVEATKAIEAGKWQCTHGNWQPKSIRTCSCTKSYVLTEEGTYREVESEEKGLTIES